MKKIEFQKKVAEKKLDNVKILEGGVPYGWGGRWGGEKNGKYTEGKGEEKRGKERPMISPHFL